MKAPSRLQTRLVERAREQLLVLVGQAAEHRHALEQVERRLRARLGGAALDAHHDGALGDPQRARRWERSDKRREGVSAAVSGMEGQGAEQQRAATSEGPPNLVQARNEKESRTRRADRRGARRRVEQRELAERPAGAVRRDALWRGLAGALEPRVGGAGLEDEELGRVGVALGWVATVLSGGEGWEVGRRQRPRTHETWADTVAAGSRGAQQHLHASGAPESRRVVARVPTCVMMSLPGPTARGCIASMTASSAAGGSPSKSRLPAIARSFFECVAAAAKRE